MYEQKILGIFRPGCECNKNGDNNVRHFKNEFRAISGVLAGMKVSAATAEVGMQDLAKPTSNTKLLRIRWSHKSPRRISIHFKYKNVIKSAFAKVKTMPVREKNPEYVNHILTLKIVQYPPVINRTLVVPSISPDGGR